MCVISRPLTLVHTAVLLLCFALFSARIKAVAGRTVNFSFLGYPSVPCLLDPEAVVLDLSHNRIQRVSCVDFSQLEVLQRLHLQFNDICSIDGRAFVHNPLLEHLDLSHNRLHEISVVPLQNLLSLRYLDLQGNTYSQIHIRGRLKLALGRLRILKLGNPSVVSLTGTGMAPSPAHLKELHVITGDLHQYDRFLRGKLRDLDKVVLELSARSHLETANALVEDLLNATKALTLADVDMTGLGERAEARCTILPDLVHSSLRELTLRNVSVTERCCRAVFAGLVRSSVESLVVDGVVSRGPCVSRIPSFQHSRLTSLSVRNLYSPAMYAFIPEGPVVKFFQAFEHLSVVDARMSFVPCIVSQSMINLKTLDISRNALEMFSLFPCCFRSFPHLRSLTADGNRLDSLVGLSRETRHMARLVNLSASYNRLGGDVGPEALWTGSLRGLILRGNSLSSEALPFLPHTLEVLDLSLNDITSLTGLHKMEHLSHLYLSHNKIFSLADIPNPSSLLVLHVDHNILTRVNESLLVVLSHQTALRLGNNPFYCDCDTMALLHHCNLSCNVSDWPTEFHCQEPGALKSIPIRSVSFTQCKTAPVSLVVIIFSVVCFVAALIAPVFVIRYRNRHIIYQIN